MRFSPGTRRPALECDGRDLPGERLWRGLQSDVDYAAAVEPAAEQLAGGELLALTQLELPQVDRTATQAHAARVDLADATGADEHAPALHAADDEAVDARRPAAHVEHHVDHVADVGSVRRHERKPCHPRYVDDPVAHAVNRRPTARPVKLCN